jgi:CelD/BcsL family acetyltransferase involved in cellulose biosynthesis
VSRARDPDRMTHSPEQIGAIHEPSVHVIRHWDEAETLESEWNELLVNSLADSIFLRFEWIRCWVDSQLNRIRPLIIVLRSPRGHVLAIAPSYVSTYRLLGLVPYRMLRAMADYATGADYPDWIIRCGYEDRGSVEIARALRSLGPEWDCYWMPAMASWSGAVDRVRKGCRQQRLLVRTRPRDFAVLELPSTAEDYRKLLSQNKRQQLRKELRRVSERSDIIFVRCRTEAELPLYLEALFELNDRRWRVKGQVGTFQRKPTEAEFYRRFSRVALAKGWLRLYALRERDEFKAIQIGYVYNGEFLVMQEGFDPDDIPGIGNVLRWKIIEACIAEGVRVVDFLGEMTEHKRRWLAKERTGSDLFVGRRSLKNALLFVQQVWPTGRFLRQRS